MRVSFREHITREECPTHACLVISFGKMGLQLLLANIGWPTILEYVEWEDDAVELSKTISWPQGYTSALLRTVVILRKENGTDRTVDIVSFRDDHAGEGGQRGSSEA